MFEMKSSAVLLLFGDAKVQGTHMTGWRGMWLEGFNKDTELTENVSRNAVGVEDCVSGARISREWGLGWLRREMWQNTVTSQPWYSLMAGTSEELGADGRKSYLGSDSPRVGRPAVL